MLLFFHQICGIKLNLWRLQAFPSFVQLFSFCAEEGEHNFRTATIHNKSLKQIYEPGKVTEIITWLVNSYFKICTKYLPNVLKISWCPSIACYSQMTCLCVQRKQLQVHGTSQSQRHSEIEEDYFQMLCTLESNWIRFTFHEDWLQLCCTRGVRKQISRRGNFSDKIFSFHFYLRCMRIQSESLSQAQDSINDSYRVNIILAHTHLML